MTLEAGRALLHYRLVEKVGEGGMGVVWKAVDTRLDREVAIKALPDALAADEQRLARFEREAKTLAALQHPGIVTIHAVERAADGLPFLVMEHVRGRTLSEVIPRDGLPADRLVELAVPLADAVAAAHRAGVTHRDLKPGNVMVTEDGGVKVLDFGLAKTAGGGAAASDATRTRSATLPGTVLGTMDYMAPEQAEGLAVDSRSDVFSLGVVLHEMATGRRPFRGETTARLLSSILRDDPPPLEAVRPDLPGDLGRIVRKCLDKDPSRRFSTASEVRDRLAALRDESRSAARPARGAGARRLPVVVVAGAAVAVLALGGWALRGRLGGAPAPGQDDPGRTAPATRKLSQVTFGAGPEQWSAWSPDGTKLVYGVEREGFTNLVVREMRTGEERPLTRGAADDIQPAWSPDGTTLAFVRASGPEGKLEPSDVLIGEYNDGDVWLVDVETGRETLVIKEGFNPAFSPDGSRIAVDASWTGPHRIWTTDDRGRNPRQITTGDSEAVQHLAPAWSPDGSRIVFQNEEKTKLDLRVLDLESGTIAALTDDLYIDLDPVWSPTGGHVYFSSYRGGGLNIWRIPVADDGRPVGAAEQLTTGAGQDIQPAVAPDGSRLTFTVLSQNADLWRLPVDPATGRPTGSLEPVAVSTREDSRGAWSTDGRAVAFNSDRDGDMNVWVHDFEDDTTRPVTRGPGGDYQPHWSPDGGSIAFFSARSGNADVWVVDVATGALRQITDDPALDTNPFFSPDGTEIAFQSDRDGRKEVWVVPAAGGPARQISTVGASDHFLDWSDDGTYVLFRSTALEVNTVHRVPAAGGEEVSLGIPVGWHMSFSPDRRLLIDAVGHKALWVHPLDGATPRKVFEVDSPEERIDYPRWSPDGRWVILDRVKPRGGDVWLLDGLR